MINAALILAKVRAQLSDVTPSGATRWYDPALLQYLTLAQRQVVLLRPDANAKPRIIKLNQGAGQTLPFDASRFLGGLQNWGSDGKTPGAAIRNVEKSIKDAFDPTWMSDTDRANEIDEVIYDPMLPRNYWIAPGANKNVYISLKLSSVPAEISATDQDLEVPEIYEMPLILYTLSMAYAENTDAGSKQLSAQYEQRAINQLGLKSQVDAKLNPIAQADQR